MDKILDKMIFLWRESKEETCSRKNPYEAEGGGGGTVHFMDELSEYKEIHDLHRAEERKLEEYREKCKNEALDMLKEYFYSLWD